MANDVLTFIEWKVFTLSATAALLVSQKLKEGHTSH
jgi:hypothetical protein